MNALFTAAEIVTMAVEAEKNGLAFYQAMTRKAKDENARNIFSFLAKEEAEHQHTFQTLLDDLPPIDMSHTDEAEYHNYLNAFASTRIFKPDVNIDELVQTIASDVDAVDIAVCIEKESILFYYELREKVQSEGRENINEIIKEEKIHLARLVQLREALVNSAKKGGVSC